MTLAEGHGGNVHEHRQTAHSATLRRKLRNPRDHEPGLEQRLGVVAEWPVISDDLRLEQRARDWSRWEVSVEDESGIVLWPLEATRAPYRVNQGKAEAAARGEHAPRLIARGMEISNVLERHERDDQFGRLVCERKSLCVCNAVVALGIGFACQSDQSPRSVDSDHAVP